MRILVSGGAGFIGGALVRRVITTTSWRVLNVDKYTYAANPLALAEVRGAPRFSEARIDVRDRDPLRRAVEEFRPTAVLHLAAESHVDRSIDGPAAFLETNVLGTFNVLQVACEHWKRLPPAEREAFRLIHVSTDEVYGSAAADERFSEESPYRPSSPYAASKASADHL